nr:MAG TPA: hypothetical protein [Bacteriophage sp.]
MIRLFINITKLLLVLPMRLALYTLKVVFLLPLVIIRSLGGRR